MSEPTYDELRAELAQKTAELEAKDAAGVEPEVVDAEVVGEPAAGTTVSAPTEAAPAAEAPAPPTKLPGDWPTKGYHGAQPWEVEEPPELSHGNGFLITGSAGDDVELLCSLLKYAGYETSVSRGENPLGIYDASVRAAVEQFRREYGIEEDPGVISATVPDVAGPWTWEALCRIARRPKAA
jgi:peptidoglycan hydrolase-like protein with peptidoglycan-binding domain